MPTVSIITPLYNKAAYITATVKSLLGQTFTGWEMLIVDNGSTDGSFQKAQHFQDVRIKTFQSARQGPGSARNNGILQSKGEWIQFLDADDLLEPNYLEQQLSTAYQNPHAEIIASYWQEFTDENPTTKILKSPAGIGKPIQALRDSSIAFAPWAVHAALVKRSALSVDYHWPEQLDKYLGEDIAFWFRLVNKCTVAYGKSQGALYRIQTPQCRTQNLNAEKWFTGIDAAIQSNLQYLKDKKLLCTDTQCENMMRVYSGIFNLAKKQKLRDLEKQSVLRASYWLNEYFHRTRNPKVSMQLRKILGIDLFNQFVRN